MIINEETYDIAIIGAGMGGSLAAYKLAKEYPDAKVVVFDWGRPFGKRRRQLEGWMGCLPNSDGKFYLSDLKRASFKKADTSFEYFKKMLSKVTDIKEQTYSSPSRSMLSKLDKHGFTVEGASSSVIEVIPKEIHALSKYMVKQFDNSNLYFVFDNEVVDLNKKEDLFHINTQYHLFKAKKVILGVGRSGWRFANKLYNHFGLVKRNDIARFGVKIELPEKNIPNTFNRSKCILHKSSSLPDNLKSLRVGRFNWGGKIIPEDHDDLIITSFRSNEPRWVTDNVSFDIMGYLDFKDQGFDQTERIGKLSLILANDRVIKEKLSTLFAKKSQISIMKEFNWVAPVIKDLFEIFPDLEKGASIHLPTLEPHTSEINISKQLETDLEGLYCIGESAGYEGLALAAASGLSVVDYAVKGL